MLSGMFRLTKRGEMVDRRTLQVGKKARKDSEELTGRAVADNPNMQAQKQQHGGFGGFMGRFRRPRKNLGALLSGL